MFAWSTLIILLLLSLPPAIVMANLYPLRWNPSGTLNPLYLAAVLTGLPVWFLSFVEVMRIFTIFDEDIFTLVVTLFSPLLFFLLLITSIIGLATTEHRVRRRPWGQLAIINAGYLMFVYWFWSRG